MRADNLNSSPTNRIKASTSETEPPQTPASYKLYSLICGVTLTWHRRHSVSMFLDGGTWHGMGAHDWYVRLRACSVGMQREAAGYTGER